MLRDEKGWDRGVRYGIWVCPCMHARVHTHTHTRLESRVHTFCFCLSLYYLSFSDNKTFPSGNCPSSWSCRSPDSRWYMIPAPSMPWLAKKWTCHAIRATPGAFGDCRLFPVCGLQRGGYEKELKQFGRGAGVWWMHTYSLLFIWLLWKALISLDTVKYTQQKLLPHKITNEAPKPT